MDEVRLGIAFLFGEGGAPAEPTALPNNTGFLTEAAVVATVLCGCEINRGLTWLMLAPALEVPRSCGAFRRDATIWLAYDVCSGYLPRVVTSALLPVLL